MTTDGSMMVGGHGGSSGARPWKWTNGWWEYMHDQGARVNMSVDGQTTIMHSYFPDLANYASRVYQEGRLVMTFTDRTIWDASFGGQKLISTRQDWSLSGNVAVERGLPGQWGKLADHPEDGWISALVNLKCSANGSMVTGEDNSFSYYWQGGGVQRLDAVVNDHVSSQPRAISEDGHTVVGHRYTYDDDPDTLSHPRAMRWGGRRGAHFAHAANMATDGCLLGLW